MLDRLDSEGVTNIDEAEIQGAEIDFKYRATEELSIYGGLATLILKLLLLARPYTAGNKLPYIPETTATFGAEYESQLGMIGN